MQLWDCRTGRSVIPLPGHHDQVLGVDFEKSRGFTVATCSGDNSCKIWDLRKRKCVTTVLAHTNCVSSVKFDSSGKFFLTSSYDKTMRVW